MILSIILSVLGVLLMGNIFTQTTSALANTGSYTTIPQVVRDYYSKEVLFVAQPRCKFLQFAKKKTDLQAIKGKSIVFTKYGNLLPGGALTEDDVLVPKAMGASEIAISVSEQANAITLTEMLMRTSLMDVLGDASKLLANDLAVTLDKQFRDTCISTTNVVYGNGAASSTAMATTDVFNSKTIKDIVEKLEMANAPKFNGEYYVCIAHPKQLRQLRDDSAWINANTYMGRRQLYIGEVGMYEGVIFISTTNMPHMTSVEVIAKYGGTFTPTYGCEAVVFGENSYAWAVALEVELRDDGVVELGRKHTIGWYGIWGTGLIEENNVIRVLTAATA
jgi:N4-gp56 family major capsid protein